MNFSRWIACLALVLGSWMSTVTAQEPIVELYPMQGAFYNPAESGSGWLIDVGQAGLVFGSAYTYRPDGSANWLVLQAQFQRTTEAERITTGIIGRVSGPLLQFQGGNCLGCTFMPPQAPTTPLTAEMVWYDTRRADVTVNGTTKPLRRLLDEEPASAPITLLQGHWDVKRFSKTEFGTPIQTHLGIHRIQPRPESRRIRFAPAAPAPQPQMGVPIPDDSVPQYELVCSSTNTNWPEDCDFPLADYAPTPTVFVTNIALYLEPSTGTLRGLYACNPAFGRPFVCQTSDNRITAEVRYDVFITGNGDRIVIRLVQWNPATQSLTSGSELILDRINP